MNMKRDINTLVLSGGGIRGVAYCGAFRKLKELHEIGRINLDIKQLMCVSVGCLFGLVFALGYQPQDIEEELISKNFGNLKDISFGNFINKFGADSGKNIITWLETLILKRGMKREINFRELYERTGIKYQVLATNLKTFDWTIFDYIKTPTVPITQAIRYSISIPFVFTAERFDGHILVDGGVINNYPIHLFQDNLDNVLGLKLIARDEPQGRENSTDIVEFDSYVMSVWSCMMVQRERQTGLLEQFQPHTIKVHIDEKVQTMDFAMTTGMKQKLIDIGYRAVEEFFRNHKEESQD
uniref:PNPLA domain-containing protein n=1 Tax=viral metagenome TaxID=1070528 RepID=A0A6C0H752_9ZZZZ